ncbi:MAG: hypothetical protein KAH32_05675 [Chlamydiia bacterium]|nr:hypothetical protein [Chlamydiia bacterium]
MIKIIRKEKSKLSELEKNPALCELVCIAWKEKGVGLPSFLRGLSCVDRAESGNKKLLEELQFLETIFRAM